MKASILTIGDELLNGQTIDTNSAWIARQLNAIGFIIIQKISVGDDANAMLNALHEAQKNADFVFITGGLGPTADDMTKPTLLKYFGGTLVLHEESLALIKQIFAKRQKQMIERNVQQAMVPSSCQVVLNHWGTAPAMRFKKNGIVFFSLPGVPYEMQQLMTVQILPQLVQQSRLHIVHRYILTHGIGESFLADKIQSIESLLPPQIKLAYLPKQGFVTLRLTGTDENKNHLMEMMNDFHERFISTLKEHIVTHKHNNVIDALREKLLDNKMIIATAESCTGGYIAHLLTQQTGASNYFSGSIIAYSNAVKNEVLHIPQQQLDEHTAVSEIVAEQMLKNVLPQMNADCGIAITGYLSAVPNDNSVPIGQVFVCVGSITHYQVHELQLQSLNREKNIEQASLHALFLLYQWITKTHGQSA